jgi:hypothetical protein
VTPGRIPEDEDAAIRLDVYLDELLAGRPGGPTQVRPEPAPGIDPDLVTAAQAVGLALARFHPSFRFEERLAVRLRAAGVAPDVEVAADRAARGVIIPFASAVPPQRARSRRVNGALIGGAISAGVSIASIAAGAIVARRRSRGDSRWERVV